MSEDTDDIQTKQKIMQGLVPLIEGKAAVLERLCARLAEDDEHITKLNEALARETRPDDPDQIQHEIDSALKESRKFGWDLLCLEKELAGLCGDYLALWTRIAPLWGFTA